jgi:hypothetical protein
MIRAIIGTVAVLAGFAVIETSSDAGTSLESSCKVTQVYALLQPGEQVPVRAEPSPGGAVVGALATQDMSKGVVPSIVTLTGSKKGWARIALNSKDYTAIDGAPHAYGWVPADLLAVDTRLDGTVHIYSRPGPLGNVMGRIENEDQKFRVLGCRDDLLQVINAKEGTIWIDRWCAKGESCRD